MSSQPTEATPTMVPHLPDEIKLQILKEYFEGSERTYWNLRMMWKRRVDPFLKLRGWAHLVSEALYSNKRVILDMSLLEMTPGRTAIYAFHYPPPLAAQHITTIQVMFKGYTGISDRSRVPSAAMRFLRRLEAGQLGFDNLELLRVVLNRGPELPPRTRFHRKFVRDFCRQPPFHFQTDKVEIVMNWHFCGHTCTLMRRHHICQLMARLEAHLTSDSST